MADYQNKPVLSKIRIGGQDYWLKDKDARALLSTVVDTDLPALDARLDIIEGGDAVNGSIKKALKDAKDYTDEKIGDLILIKYEIVTQLPDADADHEFSKSKTIYLKQAGTKREDYYEEYICINEGTESSPSYQWEKIGDTKIDLSNYYTKSEIDSKVGGLQGDIEDLDDRLDTAEGEIDALQGKVEIIEGKPAYNITSTQISNWENEVGAKAAVNAEQDRAVAAEEGLNAELTDLTGRVEDLEDKEDGWDAKLDNVKLGDNFLEVKSDVTGKGNYVDLGSIATTSGVLDGASYTDSTHKLVIHKGDGTNVVDHAFGDLADENLANLEVKGQTVSGVKASGTSTGEIDVVLDQTSTPITSTGSVTAEGIVDVSTTEVAASKVKTAGTIASFEEGAFTANVPTAIDVSKFNGGSVATYSHSGFSGGSLSNPTKSQFAVEGLVAEVNDEAEEGDDDFECLVFTAATKSNAVTEQGDFTAAVYGTDTFDGGSVASLGTGFYTPGTAASKDPDTFNGGAMPTFDEVKADKVGSASFTGSSVSVSVSGNYDKATVNAAGTKFTGKTIELNVGDIVVADKDVTKKA